MVELPTSFLVGYHGARPASWRPQKSAEEGLNQQTKRNVSLLRRVRMTLYGMALNGTVGGVMGLERLLPYGRRLLRAVEVQRDVPYREGGDSFQHLDISRPRDAEGPLPVVFYIHGGGFSYLSKESRSPLRPQLLSSLIFKENDFPKPIEKRGS